MTTPTPRPTGRPDPLAYLVDEVAALRERHLYRRLRVMSSVQGPIRGKGRTSPEGGKVP